MEINGNQNIVIQSVTDSTLTINVNGTSCEIKKEFGALMDLINDLSQDIRNLKIQYANNIYNIEHINNANFGFIVGKHGIYNRQLSKQLIEAMAKYCPDVNDFLKEVQDENPNWETNREATDSIKECIISGFVSVIGIQFRRLMAIGIEDDQSKKKAREYLKISIDLAKYALDLFNFIFLSQLWKVCGNDKSCALSNDCQDKIKYLFTRTIEQSISNRLALFENLLGIFEAKQISLPLPELKGFKQNHLSENNSFRKAVEAMGDISNAIGNGNYTALDCAIAEKNLIDIFSPLAFLVCYKMVSIKYIGYQQNKHKGCRYLHCYTDLDIYGSTNIGVKKMQFSTETAETESVWIYKKGEEYQNGINLMPFVIDYRALSFEEGARIGFFRNSMDKGKILKYIFLDDYTSTTIEWETVSEQDEKKSKWLLDKQNRIRLNFNTVIALFEQIQKAILPNKAY